MIQDLSRSTYSNIEVQGTEFVQHCLLPHLKRWEAAISRDLIVDDERYFAEHSVMGLMRGASGERAAYYTTLAGLGVLSINDIRELENLNPIGPEGDQRFMNSNMTTIEKIVAQPAPASPAAGRSIQVPDITAPETNQPSIQDGV
jgi:phage portal protein BeeE